MMYIYLILIIGITIVALQVTVIVFSYKARKAYRNMKKALEEWKRMVMERLTNMENL